MREGFSIRAFFALILGGARSLQAFKQSLALSQVAGATSIPFRPLSSDLSRDHACKHSLFGSSRPPTKRQCIPPPSTTMRPAANDNPKTQTYRCAAATHTCLHLRKLAYTKTHTFAKSHKHTYIHRHINTQTHTHTHKPQS